MWGEGIRRKNCKQEKKIHSGNTERHICCIANRGFSDGDLCAIHLSSMDDNAAPTTSNFRTKNLTAHLNTLSRADFGIFR